MNTPDEIKRQLDELDIEFESPQNQKSGKLDFARWSARRAELIALQRHAERIGRTEPAPRAAPPLSRSELDAILRPPSPAYGKFESADRAELTRLMKSFDKALDAGDLDKAAEILADDRRRELASAKSLAIILKNFGEAYVGAKTFAPMLIGAIAFLHAELSEMKLLLRMQRSVGGSDSFDAALDGRMLTLQFGTTRRELRLDIPIFRGTFRNNLKYEKSDLAVQGGSLWIALQNTADRPPSSAWQQVARGIRS